MQSQTQVATQRVEFLRVENLNFKKLGGWTPKGKKCGIKISPCLKESKITRKRSPQADMTRNSKLYFNRKDTP